LFSLNNFDVRSATVICDKTVAHCNYPNRNPNRKNYSGELTDMYPLAGFPLVGVPASLTPKNHAGTPNFGMPGVHWTPKTAILAS